MFNFSCTSPDEEIRVFFVNGVEVGRATYNDLGWTGMEMMEQLFDNIQKVVRHGEAADDTVDTQDDHHLNLENAHGE